LQHLIVEGLVNCGSAEAKEFAEDIATRWIRTNYAAYKTSGVMYEKYDVEFCGRSGGSSEYKHQVWTFFSLHPQPRAKTSSSLLLTAVIATLDSSGTSRRKKKASMVSFS
jgi:hypothetical protein